MFELSIEDREILRQLLESKEFKIAEASLLLYGTLDIADFDQESFNRIEKFLACNHHFEAFAYSDNSYDDYATRDIMCTNCHVILSFVHNRMFITKKSIVISDKVQVEF